MIIATLSAIAMYFFDIPENNTIHTVTKQATLPYTSPISIEYLRSLPYEESDLTIQEELPAGSYYNQYIASYTSEGNTIFGLLTIPHSAMPQEGFPAIVFNHGYIPPDQYVTTEKYVAYVDYLARNDFVVFKIDMRGHGNSEGVATGSYFSPGYTIDAIHAVKALQSDPRIDPTRIGMWGHSMAGNLTLRAMEVSSDIKAGVIWAGAVYSYEDFAKYRLNDGSYIRQNPQPSPTNTNEHRLDQSFISQLRNESHTINFNDPLWLSISLTNNLQYISGPLQLHHAQDDPVVNIGYSRDLAHALKKQGLAFEFYEYEGGGHNIVSPYFEQAMQQTVAFFKKNLSTNY